MSDLLIRDLPPETHAELKRRASDAGMSVQRYVLALLEDAVATPTLAEWFHRLEEVPRHPTISGATAVAAARDELP